MDAHPTTGDLLAGLRRQCTALPEVTEGRTHGAPTWFVRGRRSFAKFVAPEEHRLDERHVAFWAAPPPGARHELVAADPDRFFGPPFGGRDWVGMRLDVDPGGPDWHEVREIVVDAYRQVAPKSLVARLDGTGQADQEGRTGSRSARSPRRAGAPPGSAPSARR